MEYKTIKCESCGRFIGKLRLLTAKVDPSFEMEVYYYCHNKKCVLANDTSRRGENILKINFKKNVDINATPR